MNVVSLRKKLLAGEAPDEPVNLKDTQIEALAATVPAITIYNPNAYQYYFPVAGVYMHVQYWPGGLSVHGRSSGTLQKVDREDDRLYFEDGTRKYVTTADGQPLVFPIQHQMVPHAATESKEVAQAALWVSRKPYRVRFSGYESIYTRGAPKSDFGRPKQLSIFDGDYKSLYLELVPIEPGRGLHWSPDGALKEAIENGEYNPEKETIDEFETRLREDAQARHAAWEQRYEFQRFCKESPVEQYNRTVDQFNKDIDECKKFLKMATILRRQMREHPERFRRRTHVKAQNMKEGNRIKTSELFRGKLALESMKEKRHDDLNGGRLGFENKKPRVAWAVSKAAGEWQD